MPSFGKRSRNNLNTCHPELQRLFEEVVKHFDCSVTCGSRSKEDQEKMFNMGRSKVQYPDSKHNSFVSMAVDAPPFPPDWPDKKNRPETYVKDIAKFYLFVGYVLGIAEEMGIKIRSGADWDRDFDILDQSFDDLPHFELIL